jgi:D-beta-D-heptose 7-phosphate kinase/D-beta-D-heptose 1-phosphate adenosyltransferase
MLALVMPPLTENSSDGYFLIEHVARFSAAKVIVIGDIIMDRYIWGSVSRISPEAPVPVVDVNQETETLGGGGNVVHNMHSLGAKPLICGVVGDDSDGRRIKQKIQSIGLRTDGILTEAGRPTSVKTRIVAHAQQVVRFDIEKRKALSRETTEKLVGFVRNELDSIDILVVSDYGKGVISGHLLAAIKDLIRRHPVRIAVDPKTANMDLYDRVDVLTPNHYEAEAFCNTDIIDEEGIVRAGNHILERLHCNAVIITQGSKGMTLLQRSGQVTHIAAQARNVFDVTGAGDTVIGALSLGLASGLGFRDAAILANAAAGIVVGEFGTCAVRADALKEALRAPVRVTEKQIVKRRKG